MPCLFLLFLSICLNKIVYKTRCNNDCCHYKKICKCHPLFTPLFIVQSYDTRVKKSESRCKLACKRIFELLTLTVMCHIFKLYHIFQEKNMISIAKNAKNSPRHWVWHSKTQDICALYYRYHAYFINFAYDFYTTYEFSAIYATPNAKNCFCSHRLWYTMEKKSLRIQIYLFLHNSLLNIVSKNPPISPPI